MKERIISKQERSAINYYIIICFISNFEFS